MKKKVIEQRELLAHFASQAVDLEQLVQVHDTLDEFVVPGVDVAQQDLETLS